MYSSPAFIVEETRTDDSNGQDIVDSNFVGQVEAIIQRPSTAQYSVPASKDNSKLKI